MGQYEVYDLIKDEWVTTKQLSEKHKLDRSVVQQACRLLFRSGFIDREQAHIGPRPVYVYRRRKK